MTETYLTRNSGLPWITSLYKKIDQNKLNMIKIKKKYIDKQSAVKYKNRNDYIMQTNELNNQEQYEIQLKNAKHIRAMYLYIMRNYYHIFSFQKPVRKFINASLIRSNFIRHQCIEVMDSQALCNEKDKQYLQLASVTFSKYIKQYNDPLKHGYFIIFVLKHHTCNDMVRYICNFI